MVVGADARTPTLVKIDERSAMSPKVARIEQGAGDAWRWCIGQTS
jgi:hypothetical protein